MIIDMKIENKNCKIDIEDKVLNGLATQVIENMNEQIVEIDWEYYEDEREDIIKKYISDKKNINREQDIEKALTVFIIKHNSCLIEEIMGDKAENIIYDVSNNIMNIINFTEDSSKKNDIEEDLFLMFWETDNVRDKVFSKIKIDYNVIYLIRELLK